MTQERKGILNEASKSSMRNLIEAEVRQGWVEGYNETTSVSQIMGWDEIGRVGEWNFCVNDRPMPEAEDSQGLRLNIAECSDEALLKWYEEQMCQRYG